MKGATAKQEQPVYGYSVRDPLPLELMHFRQNPQVAGMAAEDSRIVLSPYTKLSDQERSSVAENEAARLYLRENNIQPDFAVTPRQRKSFSGTAYASNEPAIAQTLLARIVSGDPSAGETTGYQKFWADYIKSKLKTR